MSHGATRGKSSYHLIVSELEPTETLLWSGRPSGAVFIKPGRVVIGLFLALFMCLGAAAAISAGEYRVVIFGLFLFSLLYHVVLRCFVDAWRRRKTVYALTDRRALVVDGLLIRRTQGFPLLGLPALTLREGREGRGTIFCYGRTGYWHRTDRRGQPLPRPLFRMIVDVRHVYNLMRETQARLPTGHR